MRRVIAGYRGLESLWFSGVDARVYALVRIAFAVVALCNLVDLWPNRAEFFSDSGMIDLATLRANIGSSPYYSVLFFASDERMVTLVFAVAGLALLMLGLGVLQRPAAILAFVWHLSYSYRAFPIVHGWDELLRIIAFVIMISPTSSVWSVREWIAGDRREASQLLPRYGLVLLQMQLFVVYWQTLWLKLGDPYWRNGEFVSYYQLSMYSRAPLEFWAHAELLSSLLTFGTLLLEFSLPLMLLFRRTRVIGFALGFGLHFGILALSTVWLFSLSIWVPYLAFLDGRDVSTLLRVRSLRLWQG